MNKTIPQWIAKMHAGKTGRDHLGLGSVSSDQILPSLSPGINVLTVHPRYYSYYTFLLDEFWQRDRPRSKAAWVQFYRPRAFIFSLGANLCNQPEHNEMSKIVGSDTTESLANEQHDTYHTTTNYIKSRLGGYGLYYRSVIAELGLIYPGGPGYPYPVDVPSEQGKKLAAAFRKAVRDTVYYQDYFDMDDTCVPIEVIENYIHRACLCQLQVMKAPDRTLLLDAFLHGGTGAPSRRATLRLFLDLAEQTQGYPLDEEVFRQLLYFGAADNGAIYTPRNAVQETHKRWRLYQAREYYAFALDALWYYLCKWGVSQNGDVHPIPLSRLWQHLDTALDISTLTRYLQVSTPNLSATSYVSTVLAWLRELVGAEEDTFDLACDLQAPLHEHRLYRLAKENDTAPEIMVAGMVVLLSLIYLRFGHPMRWHQPEWAISQMGSEGRLSVASFVRTLRRRLQGGGLTMRDLTQWLFTDYIILQHQLVATSKLPDNTFRFRREGDRLRFYALPNRLGFQDSRFEALSTTVRELGLSGDFSTPEHSPTPDGMELLTQGDL